MFTENILDETQPQKIQFNNCKLKYLLAENKLMTVQLNSVSHLVQKYKTIIDILSKNAGQNQAGDQQATCKGQQTQQKSQNCSKSSQEQIKKILKQSELIINNCVTQCKQISNSKSIFPQDQGTITPAFFSQLVLSYEKTISQLKQSIHQRQVLLQQLQTTPNHVMKRVQEVPQSNAIVKAIQSYDVYPRISEKCRKQILQLKQRKKQLEIASCSKNVQKVRKLSSSNNKDEGDKTIKKVSQYASNNVQDNSYDKTKIPTQSMSPFEKTILIYKKKKIFNDILEARVLDLKKKIKQKQLCNQLLRKRLENDVWQNIENINHYGRNLDQDDPAFLSMLNQSIKANNLDFSVDISRVMGGYQTKDRNINLQNILKEVEKDQQNQDR